MLYWEKLQAPGAVGKRQSESCKKGPGKAVLGVLSPWRGRSRELLCIPPHASTALAGEQGYCWGEGKIPWPAPSHGLLPVPGPLLFPGISVTSVPCTEPGLPVQGPPSPCAPGLLLPNSHHQLLSLLGYPGLPAHSRYAVRVHGPAPLSP